MAISVEFLLLFGFILQRAVRGTDIPLTSVYHYKGENINTVRPKVHRFSSYQDTMILAFQGS